jgi:hypothetical protein
MVTVKKEKPMRWKVILGTMVAIGSMAAAGARAQATVTDNGSSVSASEQADAGPGALPVDESQANVRGKTSNAEETENADGTESAEPNPMSRFLKSLREDGDPAVAMPLVDDWRTTDTSTGGQSN